MKRIIYGLLGGFGVLIAAALVLPLFISINDYKPEIIAKTKEAIGRDVAIDDALSLSFFPSPKLTLNRVRVANIEGAKSKDFINIKTIRVSLSLWPLLKKHVKITKLDLDQPEVFLEKMADGRTNWTFSSPSTLAPLTPRSTTPSPSSKFEVDFEKIQINDGRVSYQANGQETQLQDINTSAKMDSLQGPYAIEGSLKALDREIKLKGSLGTLGEAQDVSMNIQVGEATSSIDGKLNLSSFTFKGHMKAKADAKTLKEAIGNDAPLLTGMLGVDSDVELNAQSITLTKAKFDIGSANPGGDLKVSFKEGIQIEGYLKDLPGKSGCDFTLIPSSKGLKGSIKATVEQGNELLNWLKIDSKSLPPALLGTFGFSTDYTFGESKELRNLSLTIENAKLHGDVSFEERKNGQIFHVDLDTPKIENILKVLGTTNPKPLGAGKLKGSIQLNPTSVNLTNIQGQFGPTFTFAGDVVIDHSNVKPHINARLSLNSINVDKLLASRDLQALPLQEGQVYLIATKKRQTPPKESSTPRDTNAPIDFGFLDKFDGQFEISAPQLIKKDIVINQPKLSAKVQNGHMDINSLTGSLYGGTFRGSGHITANNRIKGHILLQDANLKQVISQGTTIKIIAGKLTLSADLSTHGKSSTDMIQHLSGPVNITAKDGVISGFDLHAISERLASLQNIQSVLGLLDTHMGKGQTPFSTFKGDILLNEGIGTIQSMTFMAEDGQGQATGTINLPAYTLDVHSDFRLTKIPKLPPFHMHLTGPIDNPSRKLDTSALKTYMMENVFKGVIESLGKGKFKPADMLGSIVGGNNKAEPAAPQQPQSAPDNKPEKIIKDVFKGLF
jgi:AsmA protein